MVNIITFSFKSSSYNSLESAQVTGKYVSCPFSQQF